jgi:stage V sporulation protein G
MKITDVRVRLIKKDDSKLKAVASITIEDCFVVHDIKVIEGTEGYFIAMPSRKTNDGEYKDIAHPINTETREALKEVILKAFEETKNQSPESDSGAEAAAK